MQKQKLDILEVTGIRVLTTKQIAEAYGVTKDKIIYNFNYNKERYILGKHYIEVTGDELRRLKTTCENQMSLKYAKSLYLWTEKGALLHAKSLNTDKAWEVYDYLVDFYFRAKEKEPEAKQPVKSKQTETKPIKTPLKQGLPEMKNPIYVFKALLRLAHERGIEVNSFDFKGFNSILRSGTIGIRTHLLLEQVNYELAFELSHAIIHYNGGNIIESPLRKEYDEQAKRAARMLIRVLDLADGAESRQKSEDIKEIDDIAQTLCEKPYLLEFMKSARELSAKQVVAMVATVK